MNGKRNTDSWLDELAELLRDATPRPWRPDHESWIEVNDITIWCGPEGDDAECLANMGWPVAQCGDQEGGKQSHINARLICLLRNHGDEILAAVSARSAP